MKRAIVSCGAAYARVDGVRCLTNFSTGETGAILALELMSRGWEVLCLRGYFSRWEMPGGCEVEGFTTNESLLEIFRRFARQAQAVLHAAALCDYEVQGGEGWPKKIRSDLGGLDLSLKPALRVLPLLRGLFPEAAIVGWKYELDGDGSEALARGREQLLKCGTDACVVNGLACGGKFGILKAGVDEPVWCEDKVGVARHLVDWLEKRMGG